MRNYGIKYVYIDRNDDTIKLTKQELEDLLDRAYEQGYNAGVSEKWTWVPTWTNDYTNIYVDDSPRHYIYTTNADRSTTGTIPIEALFQKK